MMPTPVRKIEIPSRMASTIECWSKYSQMPDTIIAVTVSVKVMKRGVRGRKSGDIISSLRPDVAQPGIGLGELSAAHQLHGLDQGAGGVARLLLEGLVAIERVVVRGIGLVVADIAVELGSVSGRDQAHVLE